MREIGDRELREFLRSMRLARGVPEPSGEEPADEALLRYLDGTADVWERRAVEEMLGKSQYARDVVGILAGALEEVGLARAAEERQPGIVRLVLSVTHEALSFLRGDLVPVTVGGSRPVRGQAGAATTFCEFSASMGDLQVRLGFEHAQERVDARVVLSSVEGPVRAARIRVAKEGRPVVSVPAEEDGTATFSVPADGRYQIEVVRGGEVVGQIGLDLIAGA